jgi:hypothetical protein
MEELHHIHVQNVVAWRTEHDPRFKVTCLLEVLMQKFIQGEGNGNDSDEDNHCNEDACWITRLNRGYVM